MEAEKTSLTIRKQYPGSFQKDRILKVNVTKSRRLDTPDSHITAEFSVMIPSEKSAHEFDNWQLSVRISSGIQGITLADIEQAIEEELRLSGRI